jgi:fermentation-respiration switch protein FrsA (DUF1100 family)
MTNATTEGGLAIPPGCIVIHGHSLGSAVATRVAGVLSQQGKAPGGVVLESGFTSMLDVMVGAPPPLPKQTRFPTPLQAVVRR